MHPILFKIGPVTIYSYGVFVALAFLLATHVVIRELKKAPLIKPAEAADLLLYILVFGVVGARLLHVALNIRFYIKDPLQILFLNRGGLAFYGGLLSGVAASMWFLKRRGLPLWKTGDLIIPCVPLGQSIGRIGCFMNGCCYGIGRHPTQLYSAFGLFIIFLILLSLYRRSHFEGQVFLSYFILYPALRFFIDFLRGDIFPVLFGLTASQIISIAVFIIAALIMLFFRKSTKHG